MNEVLMHAVKPPSACSSARFFSYHLRTQWIYGVTRYRIVCEVRDFFFWRSDVIYAVTVQDYEGAVTVDGELLRST